MHVVVMGCGRVGSRVARELSKRGHSVAVVDMNAQSFRKLGPDFTGTTVTGVGFDRDTMVEAGMEHADAFCAVSSGDNSNIIAARVARETFGVGQVVARIYDPQRAAVYERLGIPTVATVRWTAERILREVVPTGAATVWQDPTGTFVLLESKAHPGWVGATVATLEAALHVRVLLLIRLTAAMEPPPATILQEGDNLHLLVHKDKVAGVSHTLAQPPKHED